MLSRIKNPAYAAQVDEGQLNWLRYVAPLTEHYCAQVSRRNLGGLKLACWQHITLNTVPMLLALKAAGAEITIGACNADSTDDASAAYLAERGITVLGWRGMSPEDYQENLTRVRQAEAYYLCDMGGELSLAYRDKLPTVRGALEGTTSGLNLLRTSSVPFPVFDWNSIPLKDRLENRFHVGDGIWPAFCHTTTLGLFGRRVLVIGYGPVGKGIAERARSLGAIVHVTDLDPVLLLEARYHGCEAVDLAEGLARCAIIVTATGVDGVLGEDQLTRMRPGTILFNAGHSNREIDIDWLYVQPHCTMKTHIERFDLGATHLFLLAGGSLLNLAGSAGPHGNDLFDLYTAVMLLGIVWMFESLPADLPEGLQPYPDHLAREIAQLSATIYSEARAQPVATGRAAVVQSQRMPAHPCPS